MGLRATPSSGLSVQQTNDRAVCFVLRGAIRHRYDVSDVGVLCEALGLDLDAALRRSADETATYPRMASLSLDVLT